MFGLEDLKDASVTRFGLDSLHDVYHPAQGRLLQRCQESGMAQHGFFRKSIAGANRDAMAARNAAGLSDGGPAVPEHTGIGVVPVDRKRFVSLDVLTCLDAPAQRMHWSGS
jgi:hypothetical protein